MRRRSVTARFCIYGLVLLCLAVFDGFCGEAGRTALAFLNIPVGARSSGMAGAFTAVADDATAAYWNPAGLPWLEGNRVTFVHNGWIMGLNHEYLAYARPLGNSGGMALSAIALLSGSMDRATEVGVSDEGHFTANDACFSISFSRLFLAGVAIGGTGKALFRQIDDEESYAAAADIGLMWRRGEDLRFSVGIIVRNLGQEMKMVDVDSPLPMTTVVGLGLKRGWQRFAVSVSSDFEAPRYESERFRVGGEITYGYMALRAGYRRVLSDFPDEEALSGPTFGLGITVSVIALDASYASLGGDLGSNTIVGVSLTL